MIVKLVMVNSEATHNGWVFGFSQWLIMRLLTMVDSESPHNGRFWGSSRWYTTLPYPKKLRGKNKP